MLNSAIFKETVNKFRVTWTNEINIYTFLGNIYSHRHLFSYFYTEENLVKVLEKFVEYKVIGYITINTNLHNDIVIDHEPTKVYLLCKDSNALYLSIGYIIPQLWYKFDDVLSLEEDLQHFINVYDPLNYATKSESNNTNTTAKFYIGTTHDFGIIDVIHDYFILNNYTEILLFGSQWKTHPYIEYLKNNPVGVREYNKIHMYAMLQSGKDNFSVSVHSIYSKSKITLEEHNGDLFLELTYVPINNFKISQINKIKKTNYPVNIPIDLFMIITKFNSLLTFKEILNITPISNDLLDTALQLAHHNETNLQEMLTIILKKREETQDNATKTILKKYYIFISSNIEINKYIDTDEFENFLHNNVKNSDVSTESKLDMIKNKIKSGSNVKNNYLVENIINSISAKIASCV